jgi:hypothetical protein
MMAAVPGGEREGGWNARFEAHGRIWTVRASHSARSRMPKGSEMVGMMARGRPVTMVSERAYAWTVHDQRIHLLRMELMDNGTYRAGAWASRPGASFADALAEAVSAHARRLASPGARARTKGENGDGIA